MNDFAFRLKLARKARNLSQAQLAKASGVSQAAISSYENRTRMQTSKILLLAKALEVDANWLSTGRGHMTQHQLLNTRNIKTLDQSNNYISSATWPFKHIDPKHFWQLDAAQRNLIEQTLIAMINTILAKK